MQRETSWGRADLFIKMVTKDGTRLQNDGGVRGDGLSGSWKGNVEEIVVILFRTWFL